MEYVLGRNRKVILQGRVKYVKFKGELIALSKAKHLQKQMGGVVLLGDLDMNCLNIIAHGVQIPAALFQTCTLFREIARDMYATATAMNLIIKKRKVDELATLLKSDTIFEGLKTYKFTHQMDRCIAIEHTDFYKNHASTVEYKGPLEVKNVPRNITIADYACITNSVACLSLLLERGYDVSIHSIQHLAYIIEMHGPADDSNETSKIKRRKYGDAVDMLLDIMEKKKITDITKDKDLCTSDITYVSVFQYGAFFQSDFTIDEENSVGPPFHYAAILKRWGVIQDKRTRGGEKALTQTNDLMHSFLYDVNFKDIPESPLVDDSKEQLMNMSIPSFKWIHS
jgi:hypothetical protein